MNYGQRQRKIRQFVEETIEAAEDEAGIGSPSKVFKQIGKFVIEGFNIGIAENANSSTAYMED